MKRSAFTLVEFIVSVSVVVTLMSLLLPAVQRVRDASNRIRCANNLKQLALAMHAHHDAWGRLPDGGGAYWCPRSQGWSCFYQSLPYLEQSALFNQPSDAVVWGTVVAVFVCPSRGPRLIAGRAMSDYAGNAGNSQIGSTGWGMLGNGNDGVIVRKPGVVRLSDIASGTSNTLLLGEKCLNRGLLGQSQADDDSGWVDGWDWDVIRWTQGPPQPDYSDLRWGPDPYDYANVYRHGTFGGPHPGEFGVAMADGSVRETSFDIDPQLWQQMGKR